MKNEIMIIENVRGYQEDNIAMLNLEDVARGLGFVEIKNNIEYIRWRSIKAYLKEFNYFATSCENGYIPENIFYKLCFKAKNEVARKFQDLVTDKILPAIRKKGNYNLDINNLIERLTESQINSNKALEVFQVQIGATNQKLEEHEELLKNRVWITSQEKKNIQNAVRDRIQKIAEENEIDYRFNCKFLYKRAYTKLNDNFGVATYTEIPEIKYKEALEYIKNMKFYVKDLKDDKNKQLQITVNLK